MIAAQETHRMMVEVGADSVRYMKQGEYSLKDMGGIDFGTGWYKMLVKTTGKKAKNKGGVQFFSILTKRDSVDLSYSGVFEKPLFVECGGVKYCIYKFIMQDRSKCSQRLNLDINMNLLLGLNLTDSRVDMDWFVSKKTEKDLEDEKLAIPIRATMVQYLLYMENAQQTSANISLFRYPLMEMLRGERKVPDDGTPEAKIGNDLDPYKIVPKFDDLLRRRVLCWCFQSCFKALDAMKAEIPKPKLNRAGSKYSESFDLNQSGESWSGLKLWFAPNKEATSIHQFINSLYYGHIFSPEGGDELHGNMSIFLKIAREEIKMLYNEWKINPDPSVLDRLDGLVDLPLVV